MWLISFDRVRESALKVLYNVYESGAYSNAALSRALNDNSLKVVDKAFITEIVYGTLKYTLTFDYLIGVYSSIKIRKISKWTLIILRMGMYQIFFMDKVPNSAACDESVKLAGKYGHEGTKRFVNGLLRNIIRNTNGNIGEIEFPSLSEKYGYTAWMTDLFIRDFGEAFTEEMMKSNMEPSRLTVRVNSLKTTREDLIKSLTEKGINADISNISRYGIVINKSSSVADTKEFMDGLFYIQGESSMLAAEALAPKQGDRVLDLCGAPGGKTTHIAEIMGNKGEIIAGDIFQHKLDKINETANRLGISIIKTVLHDAAIFNDAFEKSFDCVLADVPCSGTGVIRSRPEIKLTRTQEEIGGIVKIQYSILKNAGKYVKNGGALVYSTCSVLKEENIKQVELFLEENKDFNLDEVKEIYPQDYNGDGFFIVRLVRE